jgi:hypothetical protein
MLVPLCRLAEDQRTAAERQWSASTKSLAPQAPCDVEYSGRGAFGSQRQADDNRRTIASPMDASVEFNKEGLWYLGA